jgi:hypothetical protein
MAAERERLIHAMGQQLVDLPGGPSDAQAQSIRYPVLDYPDKVRSLNLDKEPIVEGTLQGIKGQYLLLDTGVINMRKYGGYVLELSAS